MQVCEREEGLSALEAVKQDAEQKTILIPVPVNLLVRLVRELHSCNAPAQCWCCNLNVISLLQSSVICHHLSFVVCVLGPRTARTHISFAMQGLSAARQKLERKVNTQIREAGGSQPELEVHQMFLAHAVHAYAALLYYMLIHSLI